MPAGPGVGACGNEGASEAPGVGETPTPVLLRGDVAVGVAWVCARGPEFTNATGLTTREKGRSKVVRGRLPPCYIGAQRDRTPAAWMLLPKESLPKIPQTAVELESSYLFRDGERATQTSYPAKGGDVILRKGPSRLMPCFPVPSFILRSESAPVPLATGSSVSQYGDSIPSTKRLSIQYKLSAQSFALRAHTANQTQPPGRNLHFHCEKSYGARECLEPCCRREAEGKRNGGIYLRSFLLGCRAAQSVVHRCPDLKPEPPAMIPLRNISIFHREFARLFRAPPALRPRDASPTNPPPSLSLPTAVWSFIRSLLRQG